MLLVLKALVVGIVFGLITSSFKLPIPAPPSFVGVAGIIGIWIGYMIFSFFGS